MKIGRRMIDWVQFEMQPTQWAEACSPGQVCAALGQRADDDEPTQWATERVDEPLGLCRPLRGLDSQTGRPTQGCADFARGYTPSPTPWACDSDAPCFLCERRIAEVQHHLDSLPGRWLPKLNLVAFRIHDPPELSVL